MQIPESPRTIIELVGTDRASLTEALEARCRLDGNRTFIQEAGRQISYGDCWDLSCRVASYLISRGVRGQQCCVASFLSNRSEGLWCWIGTMLTGGIHASLNWEQRGELLLDMIARTKASVLFTEAAGWQFLKGLQQTSVEIIVFVDATPEEAGAEPFETCSLQDVFDCDAVPIVHPAPGDIASMIFSSGSTGRAKAVLVPHNMLTRGAARLVETLGLNENDVFHDANPLYHIAGQLHATTSALVAGATLALFPRFSRSLFFSQVQEVGATYIICFANVIRYLMSDPEKSTDKDNSLRYALVAQTRPGEAEAFAGRFGVTVVDSYGMSEGEPLTLPDPGKMPPDSCGKVNPDFEIGIMDHEGRLLPVGETNHIVFRPRVPDVMMRGYAGDSDATVAAWRDLWFHTQDIGRLDQNGYLYYVDRLKFTIRRRGENIIPADIENTVRVHPKVEDCVALGVPGADGEQDIHLIVARVPGSELDAKALQKYISGRIARFMEPQFIEVRDALPYTPAGKIDRDLLINSQAGVREGVTPPGRSESGA